ncbi:hypothetical protein NOX90_01730 [Wolbachia endosymbiont of Anurida maritima]|uniref:hypothetical protein n=1 Tax=Wolbachia endosymbiont of Anurida maritima TaxID=2850562 RepID=UPI0035CF08F5
MGTTKISKFPFNIKGKVAKQHAEPIVEKNLYTILGFKDIEDFENKTSKFVNKEIWQLFVDCFAKEIDYAATEKVVKNIVCNIAKIDQGNAFTKTKHLILNEKQDNKKREKAIREAISILRKINPEKAFNELLVVKKQAESFLKNVKETQEEDQKKRAELKKKFDNTQSTIETIENFRRSQEELLRPFGSVGPRLFVETLKYIETLEKLAEVKKEELVKGFLLNHVSSLNKKHPKSRGKREDAITILSSDELKNFYNKGVKEGILQPMVSYKECRNLYDKMNQMKNESKSIIKREEREENSKKIDKSIVSAINDIKKHKEAILNCKDFQSSYIKEKKEHPFRGNACQKMIDIYQERIVGYQEKIRQNLNQIKAILKSAPQEMDDGRIRGNNRWYA